MSWISNQGGGMVYRQGPHQIDTVRVLGGGLLSSVRGYAGQWMPERPIPGLLHGVPSSSRMASPVTITHNGYGYFMGSEMVLWGHQNQRYTPEERVAVRKSMRDALATRSRTSKTSASAARRSATVFRPAHTDRVSWVPRTWVCSS